MINQIHGDITQLEVDVIVNAANTQNIHGGGVDLAIARVAGPVYTRASNRTNGVSMGQFLVSPAGNLRAKVVIDIPTIDLKSGEIITLSVLKKVWRGVLNYCQTQGYTTVATPLLGGGMVGYSKEQIIPLLSEPAKDFDTMNIQIVLFN